MQAQPLIAVNDVPTSSHWYQAVLGCSSGHGGEEYEQLMVEGRMILQLHAWEAHGHEPMGSPDIARGNGVLLWFQTADFDTALQRIRHAQATVLEGPKVNANAQHREIWLRDPDGYVVVVSGEYGDLGDIDG
jgi:catechol-2,3-dioxygenase